MSTAEIESKPAAEVQSEPNGGLDTEVEDEVLGLGRSTWHNTSFYRPRLRDNWPRPSIEDRFSDWFNFDWLNRNSDSSDSTTRSLAVDVNRRQNGKDHHTYMYETSSLVVRRGDPFTLDITLKKGEYDAKQDQLVLVFAIGTHPLGKHGSLATILVEPDRRHVSKATNQWTAFLVSSTVSQLLVSVQAPPTAIVGPYRLTVKLLSKDKDKPRQIIAKPAEHIYMLFNPWCKEDAVYLASEEERQEYVLRDSGRIYVGSHDRMSSRPWRFAQFDKECLQAACYLLERSHLNTQGHGNVTQVCRALTSQVNSKDNDGVLVGNWSGHYYGGVSPVTWNGSAAILEQYLQTKRPVKFGQCWVFSGLLTTVCRALGIPCRSITTFQAGIDRDLSTTIDWYVDEDLDPLPSLDDSNWNFHVWNEAWFRRPDLPAGYDGWQVIDSCPQDSMISDGLHCCGPAPLKAIKEGNLYLGYDSHFVFSEVNGDQITWLVTSEGEHEPLRRFSQFDYIGKRISTKAVGHNSREDITHLYKYPEGSVEERDAVERASHFSDTKQPELRKFYDEDMPSDVTIIQDGVTNTIGDIVITIAMHNTSESKRELTLKLHASASYYTGVTGEDVATSSRTLILEPHTRKSLRWTLPAQLYLNTIDEDALIRACVTGRVRETNQLYFHTQSFHIDKPDLIVKLSSSRVRVGELLKVTVEFKNPLATRLTQGVLSLEGLAAGKNMRVPLHRGVAQGDTLRETVSITPAHTGDTEIIACLNFRQLTGICGATEVSVVE